MSTARCRRSRRDRVKLPSRRRRGRCFPSSWRRLTRMSPSCRAARSPTRSAWSGSTESGRSGTTASRSRRQMARRWCAKTSRPSPIRSTRRRRVSRTSHDDLLGVFVEDKRWTASVHYRLADPVIVPGLTASVVQIAGEHGLRRQARKENAGVAPAGAGRQRYRGTGSRECDRRHRAARRRSSRQAMTSPTKTCSTRCVCRFQRP